VKSKLESACKEELVTCFEVDRIPRHMPGDNFETTKFSVLRQSLYLNIQSDSGGNVGILVGDIISFCERKRFI
jgi:hypothetical protein